MLTQAKATQRAMALNLMFEELARESLEENEASGGAHADAAAEAATLGVFRRETGDTDAFVRDAAALDDSTDAPLATPAQNDADLTPAATPATTPGGMSNRNVSFDDESAAAGPDDPANDTSETDGDSQLTPGPRVMRFLTTAGERSIAFVVDKVFADDEYYRPAARKICVDRSRRVATFFKKTLPAFQRCKQSSKNGLRLRRELSVGAGTSPRATRPSSSSSDASTSISLHCGSRRRSDARYGRPRGIRFG